MIRFNRRRLVLPLLGLFLLSGVPSVGEAQSKSKDPRARGKRGPAAQQPTKDDLTPGRWVAIEGRQIGELILATEVEVFPVANDEETLMARIQEVDPETRTLVAAGRTMVANDETEIEDGEKNLLDFADIRVGQMVEAEGVRDEEGVVRATELEIRDPEPGEKDKIEIEGAIESAEIAKNSLVVAGLKVLINRQTEIAEGD